MFSYDIDSFSDLYKDSHGFRPSASYYEWLDRASQEELQAEWEYLLKLLEINLKEDDRRYEEAMADLNRAIDLMMNSGAKSIQDCVRWMHHSYMTDGDNEFLDYQLGVRYGTVAKLLAA